MTNDTEWMLRRYAASVEKTMKIPMAEKAYLLIAMGAEMQKADPELVDRLYPSISEEGRIRIGTIRLDAAKKLIELESRTSV